MLFKSKIPDFYWHILQSSVANHAQYLIYKGTYQKVLNKKKNKLSKNFPFYISSFDYNLDDTNKYFKGTMTYFDDIVNGKFQNLKNKTIECIIEPELIKVIEDVKMKEDDINFYKNIFIALTDNSDNKSGKKYYSGNYGKLYYDKNDFFKEGVINMWDFF